MKIIFIVETLFMLKIAQRDTPEHGTCKNTLIYTVLEQFDSLFPIKASINRYNYLIDISGTKANIIVKNKVIAHFKKFELLSSYLGSCRLTTNFFDKTSSTLRDEIHSFFIGKSPKKQHANPFNKTRR